MSVDLSSIETTSSDTSSDTWLSLVFDGSAPVDVEVTSATVSVAGSSADDCSIGFSASASAGPGVFSSAVVSSANSGFTMVSTSASAQGGLLPGASVSAAEVTSAEGSAADSPLASLDSDSCGSASFSMAVLSVGLASPEAGETSLGFASTSALADDGLSSADFGADGG